MQNFIHSVCELAAGFDVAGRQFLTGFAQARAANEG